jgi:hypothetical protein
MSLGYLQGIFRIFLSLYDIFRVSLGCLQAMMLHVFSICTSSVVFKCLCSLFFWMHFWVSVDVFVRVL